MDLLADYGLFLAKSLTLLAIAASLIIGTIVVVTRARGTSREHLEVQRLNGRYEQMTLALQAATLPVREYKAEAKAASKRAKARRHGTDEVRRRVWVLRFRGDLHATAVESLREEITALLTIATPDDEVVVTLESGGGTIHGYGLAASQLARLRERGIPLTAAVDRIAASGGYMMACVAERIVCAPFAILGSIGVVAQLPNFNRLLKKHAIDFELHTAGEHKRTLTLFGENTDRDRARFREELQEMHGLFKQFVHEYRPGLDIDALATGEFWLGRRALELGLVDQLRSSDDYLLAAARDADVFEIRWRRPQSLGDRLRRGVARVGDLIQDLKIST